MEHQEAVETYAAEGYLLDELTDAERQAFEHHFADCESCFDDLREGVRFIKALPVPEPVPKPEPRYRWRDIAVAAALAAAVTAGISQVAVVGPLRAQVARMRALHIAPVFSVTDARGPTRTIVDGKTAWVLQFDIIPIRQAPEYTCTIVDAHGKTWLAERVTAEQAKVPVHIPMAAGALPRGDYSLIVTDTDKPIEFTVQ